MQKNIIYFDYNSTVKTIVEDLQHVPKEAKLKDILKNDEKYVMVFELVEYCKSCGQNLPIGCIDGQRKESIT